MVIRREQPQDVLEIHYVNESAFGRPDEADIVDQLRARDAVALSLVAVEETRVIGHILFSPVIIGSSSETIAAVGLAPMAVLPKYQNSGIGSQLVRSGLEECRRGGFAAVVVLGHPHFYPRFGFVPATTFGLRSEYKVPDDVFMAIELLPGALAGSGSLVKYQPEFN
jgi:putative acetyltransferase